MEVSSPPPSHVCPSHIHLSTLQKFQLAEGVRSLLFLLHIIGKHDKWTCKQGREGGSRRTTTALRAKPSLRERRGREGRKKTLQTTSRFNSEEIGWGGGGGGVIIRYTTWRLNAKLGRHADWFGDHLQHLTVWLLRIQQRKWRETKLQSSKGKPGHCICYCRV